jgi:hypothetical protein
MKTRKEIARRVTLMVGIWLAGVCPAGPNSTAANARFVVRGDTVYDRTAHLSWQRCSVGQRWSDRGGCVGTVRKFSFDEAQRQARGRWRLPNKEELAPLIDPERQSEPRIDVLVFPNMDLANLWYWSSSAQGVVGGWYVGFSNGWMGPDRREALSPVRLVRDGP